MNKGSKRGRPPYEDILTPAEWRVVHLAQHGLSNRQIAERRGVSRDAVKFHISNVVAKIGLENKQALKGWFAKPMNSALRGQGGNMDSHTKLGPIGQISRSVSDIDRSEAWYRDVLELRHLYRFGTLAFFDCGGTRLFLEETDDVTDESVIYFKVSDIARSYERLRERGVEFTHAPHMVHRHDDGTEEWMAFFKDPDGRLLAIISQVKAP
ncbi:MAG: VOC family protein [Pseudomonadota bacterium]